MRFSSTTVLIAILATTVAAAPGAARAASDYDRICGANSGLKNAASAQEQKRPYCEAAKTAKDGASSNDLLWKVWAGVAGVCTTACVMSLAGNPMNQLVCASTNIAGGVTDALVTKQFASSLMSIGLSMGSLKTTPKGGKDLASCAAAALATMQVVTKKKAADAARESMNQNLASAQKLESSASGAATTALAPIGGESGTATSTDTSPLPPGGAAGCGQLDALACAASRDSTLPAWVKNESFSRELKANSGKSPESFLAAARSASGAVSSAAGSALNDLQLSDLRTAVAQAEKDFRYAPSQSVEYAAGGSGARKGESGSDEISFDPLSFINGLVGGQTSGAARAPSGVSAQSFDSKHSSKTSGLFDRVSDRYRQVVPRMEPL